MSTTVNNNVPALDPVWRTAHASHAVLLDMMGQPPIVFQRVYAQITKSITAGLWLSYALSKIPPDLPAPIYAFFWTTSQCEEMTGLTRAQQENLRSKLRKLGFLKEVAEPGQPVQYQLLLDKLGDALLKNAEPTAKALFQQIMPNIDAKSANRQVPIAALRKADKPNKATKAMHA